MVQHACAAAACFRLLLIPKWRLACIRIRCSIYVVLECTPWPALKSKYSWPQCGRHTGAPLPPCVHRRLSVLPPVDRPLSGDIARPLTVYRQVVNVCQCHHIWCPRQSLTGICAVFASRRSVAFARLRCALPRAAPPAGARRARCAVIMCVVRTRVHVLSASSK